jgi:multifunctional methyltransferase subunit TRM112
MRLLTHNQLVCVRKGCQNAFPLQLTFLRVEQEDSEPNASMVLHLLPRLEYPVLLACAKALRIDGLPDALPESINIVDHRDLLELLHTVLFDIHVVTGSLTCPVCSHIYDIVMGIPSMRVDEKDL